MGGFVIGETLLATPGRVFRVRFDSAAQAGTQVSKKLFAVMPLRGLFRLPAAVLSRTRIPLLEQFPPIDRCRPTTIVMEHADYLVSARFLTESRQIFDPLSADSAAHLHNNYVLVLQQ
jgi:hypothetical protein